MRITRHSIQFNGTGATTKVSASQFVAGGAGDSFTPASILVALTNEAITLTGRGLRTTDTITLELGTTCPVTGGSITLTSGVAVGGVSGARTLTATAATAATVPAAGYV